jgi:hypothetical protein
LRVVAYYRSCPQAIFIREAMPEPSLTLSRRNYASCLAPGRLLCDEVESVHAEF